jgi:hypothetical protein
MTAKGSLTPDDSQSPVFPSSVALTSTPETARRRSPDLSDLTSSELSGISRAGREGSAIAGTISSLLRWGEPGGFDGDR